nr:LysR family substrate-binding domain-containing protein [Ramlibacter aurantiacus]
MFSRARAIGQGEQGSITVGCSYTTSRRLVPQAIRLFAQRYPSVTVKLIEAQFDRQVEYLARGLTDLAVIRLPVRHADFVARPLYEEDLVVALPPDHRLAGRARLRLRELRQEVFINASRQPVGLFDSVRALCESAGFTPQVLDICSNAHSAVGLVGAGMGIALVPESVRHADHKHVVYKPLSDSPRSVVGAVCRRNHSAATQLFVDTIAELAG